MKKQKAGIGVWMDLSHAKLLRQGASASAIELVLSPYRKKIRIPGETPDGIRLGNHRSTNNEHHKHNRVNLQIQSYYKKLSSQLKNYDSILLLGPSHTLREFRNFLKNHKSFNGKKIAVKPSDYITDNQIAEHVKKYFS